MTTTQSIAGRSLAALALLYALAAPASAAPTVSFAFAGMNGSHELWDVLVTPDIDTFVPNSSLEVELDIFVHAWSLTGASLDASFWNVNGDSPGNNPFTGTVTHGVTVDTGSRTIFVAAGSELFATATPMRLLTIESTLPWAIRIGGRTVLLGTPEVYQSSRIAQNGINYDGNRADLVICMEGDFNCNGAVENADLTLLLNNWGAPIPPIPAGWRGPIRPGFIGVDPIPFVGNAMLTELLNGWGNTVSGNASPAFAIPEPAAFLLALLAFVGTAAFARRR